jgi:hypothetical protein
MRTRREWQSINAWKVCSCVCLFVAAGIQGCSCDSLYGLDSARPALGDEDTFDVDPACPDLVLDRSALALTPRVVTLTGRRENGLGAESVPVTVRIGDCDEVDDHGGKPPASGDGGADAELDAVDGAVAADASAPAAEGEMSVPSAPVCTASLPVLDRELAAAFELVEIDDRGCRSRSPFRMDCTLDASGEAAFGVVGQLPADGVIFAGYLPICVTPLELNEGARCHQKSLSVIPRFGRSQVALAVVELGGDEAEPVSAGAQCESLLRCEELRTRARFQAGFVSTDVLAGGARAGDFRSLSREATLTAELRESSALPVGPEPFLTTDSACRRAADLPPRDAGVSEAGADAGGDAEDAAVDSQELEGPVLRIGAGQRDTPVFYLCAPSYAASYQVTPRLVSPVSDSTLAASANVELTALREGFVAVPVGNDLVLFEQRCGEERRAALRSSIVERPPSVTDQGDQILISCPRSPEQDAQTPSDASLDDANPSGPEGGSAGGSADGAACQSVTLELSSGGTCSLNVTAR